MKKLFILFIFILLLVPTIVIAYEVYNDVFGVVYNLNDPTAVWTRGEVISLHQNDVSAIVVWINVSADPPNQSKIYNGSGDLLLISEVTDYHATFNYTFYEGVYYIVFDHGGDPYNGIYKNGDPGYPITGINVDYLKACYGDLSNHTLESYFITNITTYNGTAPPPAGYSNLNVNLTSPSNNTAIAISSVDLKINYTYVNLNISNVTYYVYNYTMHIFNVTTINVANDSNGSSLNITNLFLGNYQWNAFVCGTNTSSVVCNWSKEGNYTFSVGASIESEIYPIEIYETEYAKFEVNVSLISGANLFAAKLNYNGTSYLATKTSVGGGIYTLTRYIDIPTLKNDINSQNISFTWTFEYLNSIQSSQNTTTRSHNVTKLIFTQTNTTYPTSCKYNFSLVVILVYFSLLK